MKQNTKIAILAGLIVLAGVLWYFNRSKSIQASGPASVTMNHPLLAVENPELHRTKIEAARKTEYASNGRNPFSAIAPPPANTTSTPVVQVVRPFVGPTKEPPPPPLTLPPDLKFFGYGTVPNGSSKRAFFTQGEDVLIVAEGETFLGRYRVVKVNNTNLEFEEISTGRRSTAPLVEDQGAGPS